MTAGQQQRQQGQQDDNCDSRMTEGQQQDISRITAVTAGRQQDDSRTPAKQQQRQQDNSRTTAVTAGLQQDNLTQGKAYTPLCNAAHLLTALKLPSCGSCFCVQAILVMEVHAHLSSCEIIGLLGGIWQPATRLMRITAAYPCRCDWVQQHFTQSTCDGIVCFPKAPLEQRVKQRPVGVSGGML